MTGAVESFQDGQTRQRVKPSTELPRAAAITALPRIIALPPAETRYDVFAVVALVIKSVSARNPHAVPPRTTGRPRLHNGKQRHASPHHPLLHLLLRHRCRHHPLRRLPLRRRHRQWRSEIRTHGRTRKLFSSPTPVPCNMTPEIGNPALLSPGQCICHKGRGQETLLTCSSGSCACSGGMSPSPCTSRSRTSSGSKMLTRPRKQVGVEDLWAAESTSACAPGTP